MVHKQDLNMTQPKTYKEMFADWFDQKRSEGMVNFKPSFNHEAIAQRFGAGIFYDEYGLFSHLDFSDTKYQTILHPEVQEYIYEGLYKFVTAPARRIRNNTDKWGNPLDNKHPDYATLERKIEHVRDMRKMGLALKSRWELELVLEGHCEPTEGRTVDDYKQDWEDHLKEYKEAMGREWPHPRMDDNDVISILDADLEIQDL